MYFNAIAQVARNFGQIETYLDKAEQLAAAKKIEIDVLLAGRLAPDMGPFIYQVQSASDYLKGGAAWLSGRKPPRYEDNERTIEEVRARIRKTLAFVESVTEDQYGGAKYQEVVVSWSPPGMILPGDDYLLQIVIPNAYFHIVTAYAILRHQGVDVGKTDFFGPIDWIAP